MIIQPHYVSLEILYKIYSRKKRAEKHSDEMYSLITTRKVALITWKKQPYQHEKVNLMLIKIAPVNQKEQLNVLNYPSTIGNMKNEMKKQ